MEDLKWYQKHSLLITVLSILSVFILLFIFFGEILITKITINSEDIEIDISENKTIEILYEPLEANAENIIFYSQNKRIVNFDKDTEKSTETQIFGKITPVSEGKTTIYCMSNKRDVKSNVINITITDKARIEREKQEEERKQQEFLNSIKFIIDEDDTITEIVKGKTSRITIEVEPSSIDEEKIELYSENPEIAEVTSFDTSLASAKKFIMFGINGLSEGTTKIYAKIKDTDAKSSEIIVNVIKEQKQELTTSTDNSRTVYITPSGKKYHFDPDCGGKNSFSTTLNQAIKSGKDACKKCAQ